MTELPYYLTLKKILGHQTENRSESQMCSKYTYIVLHPQTPLYDNKPNWPLSHLHK